MLALAAAISEPMFAKLAFRLAIASLASCVRFGRLMTTLMAIQRSASLVEFEQLELDVACPETATAQSANKAKMLDLLNILNLLFLEKT